MSQPKEVISYRKIHGGHKLVFSTKGHGISAKKYMKKVRKELKRLIKLQ